MTAEELIEFEEEIAGLFEQGKIKAPVHLHGGNENQLIEIFKEIQPEDWVFSTHRSHYHALLKGLPRWWVREEILQGNSIHLSNPAYHFFTSAIVGGVCPIALGVAMTGQKVWVFVGDMAAETGIFHECLKYAWGHQLPIKFIIENNGMSVDSPTREVWGVNGILDSEHTKTYNYERVWPHQGMGTRVQF